MKERNRYSIWYLMNITMFLVLAISSNDVFAQQQKLITGTISDKDGSLAGVIVRVKGTTKQTSTIDNGKYSIQARAKDTLSFHMVGMKVQETIVGNRSVVNVIMESDNSVLNEVVVIGYGSVTKTDLTGAVGMVKVDELAKAPVASFAEA